MLSATSSNNSFDLLHSLFTFVEIISENQNPNMPAISKRLFSIFLLFFICAFLNAQQPQATEIRAVWLTTNWGLDWPSSQKTTDEQKADLRNMLDKLQQANFNTVFFQARIRGDVFYYSSIEPLSPYFTSKGGKRFDPLAFVIEECHRRGLECHAWFVTFPLGSNKYVKNNKQSPVNKQRSLCKLHRGEWYLDPGNPQARQYILTLVDEIVKNYDIDGIHFDYIRYPENDRTFPDSDTYRKYGKKISLEDWRRDNINKLVHDIYKQVKSRKNWVQVSSSPLGRLRSLPTKPFDGWTAYEDVFQDVGHWLKNGIHDAVYPMMYYRDELFFPYLADWHNQSNGRLIVPGIGSYLMTPSEKNWELDVILDQLKHIRQTGGKGEAFFRASTILDNTKGLLDSLKTDFYKYPAKLPPMTWLDSIAPPPPIDLEVFKTEKGLTCIRWQPPTDNENLTYTVYNSFGDNIDLSIPQQIVATNMKQTEIYITAADMEVGVYYTVTTSDRYHNESKPCESAFFVHASYIK